MSPPNSIHKLSQDIEARNELADTSVEEDPDAEFGGHEERIRMEKKLLRKLDARMSILVIIYILNYVSDFDSYFYKPKSTRNCRSIGTMQRQFQHSICTLT